MNSGGVAVQRQHFGQAQDLVQSQGHHGAQGLHDNGRAADAVDVPDGGGAGAEAPQGEPHHAVAGHQHKAHCHANQLAQHRGDGGACHAQGGEGAQAEDEHRVQDQVDDCADALDDHGPHRIARGLKHPLAGELHADPQREHGHNGEVLSAVFPHQGVAVEEAHKAGAQGQAEDQKDHPGEQIEEIAVEGHGAGGLRALFAQAAGEHGVDAHAGATQMATIMVWAG